MTCKHRPHPDQHYGCITYSQHGEDLFLVNLFKLMGIDKPSYLDLGAHDPLIISNTALLYERGSRGVNVEANPVLYERFKQHRPEDINVNVGVDTLPGTACFYMYGETSGRNTFDPDEVERLKGILTVQKEITLPVKTLKQIVFDHCPSRTYPDLLSCDIEGLDYNVLSTLPVVGDERTPPKVVCVETRRHEGVTMKAMMSAKGFHCICRMGENLIFIRNDLRGMIE